MTDTTTTTNEIDPLAPVDSTPSVSWDNGRLGVPPLAYRVEVLRKAELRQKTEYGTGKPLTWDDGNPRMQVALKVRVLDGPEGAGEERGLWFDKSNKEGTLMHAIKTAAAPHGGVQVGGVLTLTQTKRDPKTKVNTFTASYEPPASEVGF